LPGLESQHQSYQLQQSSSGGGDTVNYSQQNSSQLVPYPQQQAGGLLLACHHCPFRAGSHAQLTSHLTALHRDLKPPGSDAAGGGGGNGVRIEGFLYPCDKCEFRSVTAQALRKHRQTAHNPPDAAAAVESSDSRFYCAKCDYSSTSRINFKAHVARAHHGGKAAASSEEAVEAKKEEPAELAVRSQSGVFQPMLPLYAAAGSSGGPDAVTVRLQQQQPVGVGLPPLPTAATVLPVYHLTVKGPDHHIFTFHPAGHKAEVGGGVGGEVGVGGTAYQQAVAHKGGAATPFLPVVSSYQQQQQQPPATSNGPTAVTTETIWRPEYDSYLSSV
jgi:hypothetical protein